MCGQLACDRPTRGLTEVEHAAHRRTDQTPIPFHDQDLLGQTYASFVQDVHNLDHNLTSGICMTGCARMLAGWDLYDAALVQHPTTVNMFYIDDLRRSLSSS